MVLFTMKLSQQPHFKTFKPFKHDSNYLWYSMRAKGGTTGGGSTGIEVRSPASFS